MPALYRYFSLRISRLPIYLLIPGVLFNLVSASAQQTENFDESKVGTYTLPKLLSTDAGKTISTAKEWEELQRPVLLQKFANHVYGRFPGKAKDIHYKVTALDAKALNGKATRKEITIYFTKAEDGPSMHLLLYLPNAIQAKVPVFAGLNFNGNHAVQQDTGISISPQWSKLHPEDSAMARGNEQRRFPLDAIIDAGYGLATAWYEELEHDQPNGWRTGIRTTLQKELNIAPEEWGAIGAWAWGLSRMMDYLETDERVNSRQVVITGHSRLSKAALWAAANDQRFAIVVSNNSGEGGAALARRNFGETVYRINTKFPHWFVDAYKRYNSAVDRLPVDQHMLLALMAPRPLYVASASQDQWADPKGEFHSAKEAGKVYALYNLRGIEESEQPGINQPIGNTVRYHIREGKHDMLLYDWQQYIAFADRVFRAQ